ncbi:hypothetical protein B5F37_13610 [Drancourtella sp. An210]|nr:hypothetical protein B5F37_13610 [Drancourtella sp. An210]
MKTIEIYCNYGVLGSEKLKIYTYGCEHAAATCSEKMTVYIPDGWETYENYLGQTMVTSPWGWDYAINEVLNHQNGEPVFLAKDKNQMPHTYYLRTKEQLEAKKAREERRARKQAEKNQNK